ncbi:MAG: hypothetical protein HQ518_02140 [Rhodopirellula sp.]|nr:hypothetical protein [Rhodopirellula sp.]
MAGTFRDRPGRKAADAVQPVPAGRLFAAAWSFGVFVALLGDSVSLVAADDPAAVKPEPPRSTIFRLPDFLKLEPEKTPLTKQVPSNRFLTRASQLLSHAQALETAGNPVAALEMARRAESVVKAAQHTTGLRWPADQESPQQYISSLKKRTGITEKKESPTTSNRAMFTSGAYPLVATPNVTIINSESARPDAETGAEAEAENSTLPGPRTALSALKPASVPAVPVRPQLAIPGQLLLDWGNRIPASGIQLTSGTQETSNADGAGQARGSEEAQLLIQQLDELETWNSIDPPAGDGTAIRLPSQFGEFPRKSTKTKSGASAESSPPLTIPGLIKRPDGIDDRNVEPIPTRPTHSVSGSPGNAVTTTIPVMPESSDSLPKIGINNGASDTRTAATSPDGHAASNVYDSSPRLLTHSRNTDSAAATTASDGNHANVWQLAAAQFVSTFLGVIVAVGLFLLIRAVATKLFGSRLGVTFQFGSSARSAAHSGAEDESADVVPFDSSTSQSANSTAPAAKDEPKRAGGVASPADFPFRVVGSSNGEDERTSAAQSEHERDAAILKSVFEHNFEMMGAIDRKNESAA